ncbi:hypothetical protein CPC08DRAFT_770852 [Agrocybe pediades]|nr:hypothetical protein CPC08DRAFT_770852 [Agrocybe pediades]
MASTAQPSLPAPTRSTVMEINGRGSISSRQVSHTGAWKHPDNRMAPYPAPQAARSLANRLGARPSGPLLGRLEQVAESSGFSQVVSLGLHRSRSTTPVPPSSSTTSFDDQMVVDETAPPLTTDEEVELFGEETAGAEEFAGTAEYYENRRQLEAMTPEELVAELRRNAESREPTPALRWEDEESDYGVDDPAAYADYYVDRQGLPLTPDQHPSKKRRNSVG